MGSTTFPAAAAGKTRFVSTLTSGTNYTVPAGVTYLNVTTRGGGGGGGGSSSSGVGGQPGGGGAVVTSIVTTTPGATIVYAIGAGGVAGQQVNNTPGQTGGTTTFTGADSALGGKGGASSGQYAPTASVVGAHPNGGQAGRSVGSDAIGGIGGPGSIDIEYWA